MIILNTLCAKIFNLKQKNKLFEDESSSILNLRNTNFESENFSGKRLKEFYSEGCHFLRCNFEDMRVEKMCFGIGEKSIYTECSFDRSTLSGRTRENARFIRCSFNDTSLVEFRFSETEFIDCTFSGKLSGIVFYGNRFLDNKNVMNEFSGNNFSGASFQYVLFLGGIDLSRQMLPIGEEYIYVPNGQKLIEGLKKEMDSLPKKLKIGIMLWVELYEEDVTRGQTQFFLREDELSVNRSVIPAMASLIRKILARQNDVNYNEGFL